MDELLDLERELNIELFDRVVIEASSTDKVKKEEAERILLKFKELPNSWTKVDFILNNSRQQQSHYVALRILEDLFKTKWYLLDDSMKEGMRVYIFKLVIEKSGAVGVDGYVLQELNKILIEIAKRDWPRRWPSFISDLINISQSISMEVCKNSLKILKRFNEEVFTFSEDKMTTCAKRLLRNQLKLEFPQIFGFIKTILEFSQKNDMDDSLLEVTFEAFSCYCESMPLDFVFLTDIVELVLEHLNSAHSVACLNSLIEIVELCRINKSATSEHNLRTNNHQTAPNSGISSNELEYKKNEKILLIHRRIIQFLSLYFDRFSAVKFHEVYGSMDMAEKGFVYSFSRLLSTCYDIHLHFLEEKDLENTKIGLDYLIQVSMVDNDNLFGIILEGWNKFVFDLYSEYPFSENGGSNTRIRSRPEVGGNGDQNVGNPPYGMNTSVYGTKRLRRNNYVGILNKLLHVLVEKMPRPEEVYVVVNEYNELVREKMTDTQKIEFYRKMKGAIYHLAFLIEGATRAYFVSKIGKQVDDREWDRNKLNRLCWGMGSLAGAFSELAERDFFVEILKILLSLCEMKKMVEDRAVIASNIMFLVGQYHRFLNHSSTFLKTVIKKLFEFMDEEPEGIKDMVCDVFFKITERLPIEFLNQRENNDPLVVYILKNFTSITRPLEYYQRRIIIEAILGILKEIPKGQNYLHRLLSYVDLIFGSLATLDIFSNDFMAAIPLNIHRMEVAQMLSHVIKSHTLTYKILPDVCLTSYNNYFTHFFSIFEICNTVIINQQSGQSSGNNNWNPAIPMQGNNIAVNNAKAVKADITELFRTVCESKFVLDDYINALCERILFDYKNNAVYKEPLILDLTASIIKNVSQDNSILYLQRETFIINTLLVPSLPYVLKPDENVETAMKYLSLIETMLKVSFRTFFPNLFAHQSFKDIYNSLLFALVSLKDISDRTLSCLLIIFKDCYDNKIYAFFTQYYLSTLENILGIIFDRDMKNNFDLQCKLLRFMICCHKTIPDLNPNNYGGVGNSNLKYLSEYVFNLFIKSFPNITQEAVRVFSVGMFELCSNEQVFKAHLEDFRVKIYEYGTDENLEEEIALKNERLAQCTN